MRCVIIDDEPLALELLESYINKTPFLTLVGKYSNAIEALEEIKNNMIDLAFVDIQMPTLNGLEFSKLIGSETRIIFTTAFDYYAIDSYKVNALDYLLKPITYPDFLQAANKALNWFKITKIQSLPERESIIVKSDYKHIQIKLNKILYVEGLKDYIKIYIHEQAKPTLTLMSMKSMEELLPPAKFMRVHRSFIVNKNRINAIDRGRIIIGKNIIPVSESYKSTLLQFLNERS